MQSLTCDILIVGGGMVGLSLANQLIEQNKYKSIILLDKAATLGQHSSGRNSGVLHAGIYYKPGTLKAKVSVEGASRLKQWIVDKGLSINKCGKVIVPTKIELDNQLDILKNRGQENGAKVEMWDEKQLKDYFPDAHSASGRAIWSPSTCVIKPLEVLKELENELNNKGLKIIKNITKFNVFAESNFIELNKGHKIKYGHLINCAGLNADKIAHKFKVGLEYTLLPFKGLYWQLRKSSSIKIPCNLYPVPDLNLPFLGVHFTPSADHEPLISIGPTATLAFGRENYELIKGLEPIMALSNVSILAQQYIKDLGNFRHYVHDQAFLSMPNLFLKAAKELIPSINYNDIEKSKKVGIRAQLYNINKNSLEDDFLCISGPSSTHILNAISPAFTASFALADLIIKRLKI